MRMTFIIYFQRKSYLRITFLPLILCYSILFFWIFEFYFIYLFFIQQLLITYLFYTCQSQSPNPSHPTNPLGVHTFVLYVCVSVSALQIGFLYHFAKFHIYALIYDICFSLSDLIHSEWQSLGPPMSLQMAQFCSFLWLSNIPLYIYTTSFLSIPLWWTFRLLPCPGYCK